jgi:hypothetical protein
VPAGQELRANDVRRGARDGVIELSCDESVAGAAIDPEQKNCIVLSHPSHKNKNVARVGHPVECNISRVGYPVECDTYESNCKTDFSLT